MILTGIADEASPTIAGQIETHRALGWDAIELRMIDGQNITAPMAKGTFERLADEIDRADLSVVGFGSAIGNWSRPITGDFEVDVADLQRTIPRMKRFGTRFVRTMSWLQGDATEDQWHRETVRRYRYLAEIAAEGDIFLAHENCTGWAGQSAWHTQRLIEEVNSDNLVVLFDTGNTISHGYEPWDFYTGVKHLIRYVHVKDCIRNPDGGRSSDYTWPGQGDAMVREVLTDLLSSGYDGVISIEPHVAAIVHDADVKPSEFEMYESYLKYARQSQALVNSITTGGV